MCLVKNATRTQFMNNNMWNSLSASNLLNQQLQMKLFIAVTNSCFK